jgi:hypothetical protein
LLGVSPLTELLPAPQPAAAVAVVERAPVTVTNADGRAEPLCLIRSWDDEARLYANLVRHLPAAQPVYTIAPPRRHDYRDYPRDVAAWAEWCREQLRSVPHQGSLVLGGISFGGVLALELAKLLIAEGVWSRWWSCSTRACRAATRSTSDRGARCHTGSCITSTRSSKPDRAGAWRT